MNEKHPKLEELLANGGISLTDEEYLTLLLSYSKVKAPEKTARQLLAIYGSFSAVIDADPHLLMNSGISADCAVLFRLISRFSAICAADNDIDRLTDSEKAIRYFSSLYVGTSSEHLTVAAVDKNMRITAVGRIASGNAVSVAVVSRDIADFVVKHKAQRIFIAHNHPSGSPKASDGDISATKTIIAALSKLGTALIDHIIISRDAGLSMRSEGICPGLTNQPCDGYEYG